MQEKIGQYELTGKLAESKTMLVVRGRRISDGEAVVLKILKESATEHDNFRLRREFAILSKLNISGVIKVYNLEESEHTLILSLEDIGGESLDRLLADGKMLPLEKFLELATGLAETLARLHDSRIIHKHINPSHIIVNTTTGQFRLIGFEFADEQSQQTAPPQAPAELEGKLEYISPEQTGRMNRTVDYRTDFYSLGVTFYQLLTGRLPFVASDALGIIHLHIAGTPVSPQVINPAIPKTLSRIVLKLMAKMADDRYQNAWGLKADLDRCLHELHTQWVISDFEPGSQDFSDRLQMPQNLYGRSQEMNKILAAFERTYVGEKELFLVAGYAGVGKTRLIRELQRTVIEKQGYFIESKFEQLQRAKPYWGWVQAFKILCDYLLMENEANLDQWKRNILKAVGSIGKVLTDVIPDLELIIGPQPDVPELGGIEAQNRFNYVFVEFIKVIAGKEYPLIVFLDDLQWIDAASLKLLQIILTDNTVNHLLIIGAYRDNEVDALHPLMTGIEALRKYKARVEILTIGELTEETTNRLIADILRNPPAQTTALTRLIFSKTGGNPFFIIQTLMRLIEKRVITFEKENHVWRWDNSVIERIEITDNVIALMIEKIRLLTPESRRLLPLAACVGYKFSVLHLSIIAKQLEDEILEGLRPALHQGLIASYDGQYQFVHDRVQQAAYSLIPDSEKKKVHLEIGRLLLGHLPIRDHDEQLFTMIDHLNIGAQLIESAHEKFNLARLNLRAGNKAKASGAFLIATRYFEAGLNLLDKESWTSHYELTLELHTQAAEAASLAGDFERTGQLFTTVITKAKSAVDMTGIYESRIKTFISQSRLQEALSSAIEILERLGMSLPAYPAAEDIADGLEEVKSLHSDKSIESFLNLPEMTDCNKCAIARILAIASSPAFLGRSALYQLFTVKSVSLSIRYGNAIESPFFYAIYALFLGGVLNGYDSAYRFGNLAIMLLESKGNVIFRAKAINVVYGHVWYYKEHLRTTLSFLEAGYQSGVESGDQEFAGYNVLNYCINAFFSGVILQQLGKTIELYYDQLKKLRAETSCRSIAPVWQAVLNLMEPSGDGCQLLGKRFDQNKMIPVLKRTKHTAALVKVYVSKMILCYLSEEYVKAFSNSEMAEINKDGMSGTFMVSAYLLYDSLIRIQLLKNSTTLANAHFFEKISTNQQKLKLMADSAPMNFLHKYYLVEAERMRVTGQDGMTALDYYDWAISLARQNKYIQEEALANELAAKFWLEKGKEDIARPYMLQAHRGYLTWGAVRKVKDLENRYGSLFIVKPETTTNIDRLDLTTVMKATRAISSEIEMKNLLNRVIHSVIENAGAQYGYLLMESDGVWTVIAEGEISREEVEIPSPVNIDKIDIVSSGVVRFVARTKNKIVLDDAAFQGEFVNDPHIRKENTKSLLCAPLLHRGKLISILYLENNLTTYAFTPERVQFLEMLLSQVAISLENAAVYEALRKSESKYRLIVETASEGVLSIGPDTKVTFVNSRMTEMLGYSLEEMLRQPVNVLVPEEDRPELEKRIENRHYGIAENYELRFIRKDGRIIWTLISAVPLFDKEKCFSGSFAMVTDITERKEAEDALMESQKNLKSLNENLENIVKERTQEVRELSKALTVAEQRERQRMSHLLHEDILQILLSTNLRISMLAQDIKNDPEVMREVSEVKEMNLKAINSTNALAVEFNPPVLKREGLDIALKWLIRHFHNQYGLKVSAVSLDPCREMDPDIRFLLVQLVRELFLNIVKHAKTNKAEISVRCSKKMMRLFVRDRGVGFDVDKAREVAKVREFVGLFSIEERLKLIGGCIKIVSVPGKGTLVRIVVPIEVSFV